MTHENSTILRFGPYEPPIGYSVGDAIKCAYRGREVVIGAMTDAPKPWFKIHQNGKPFVILCGDLIRAVKLESEVAVAHHWGVNVETVRKWRRVLNVARMTAGSRQVFRVLFESRISPEAMKLALKDSKSQEALQKMVASKTGGPMHPNTRKALLRAVKKPKSKAHRDAISRAHIARRTTPPNGRSWKKEEDERLGRAPDKEIAIELDRSVDSVRRRRSCLQIPRFRG